jgi:hypothetical protein
MLIRRRVVQEDPQPDVVENNVTVVRPERPTGLLVGLGVATLLAIGAVTYLSWYLPNKDRYATEPIESGRAQRFERPAPAPKPNTVIVNPPPVIQTPPPVVTTPPPVVTTPPVVVNPPRHDTIIVPGPSSSDNANDTTNRRNNSNSNSNNNSGDDDTDTRTGSTGSTGSTTGDVDGTVVGRTGG